MLRQREAAAAEVVGNKSDLDCEQREHLDFKEGETGAEEQEKV